MTSRCFLEPRLLPIGNTFLMCCSHAGAPGVSAKPIRRHSVGGYISLKQSLVKVDSWKNQSALAKQAHQKKMSDDNRGSDLVNDVEQSPRTPSWSSLDEELPKSRERDQDYPTLLAAFRAMPDCDKMASRKACPPPCDGGQPDWPSTDDEWNEMDHSRESAGIWSDLSNSGESARTSHVSLPLANVSLVPLFDNMPPLRDTRALISTQLDNTVSSEDIGRAPTQGQQITTTNSRRNSTSSSPTAQLEEGVTTLMLRNLPLDLKQSDLMEEMDSAGFKGCYDFCYMPSSFSTSKGKGYAFVNFSSPVAAIAIFNMWQRRQMRSNADASSPSLNISAASVQGRDASVAKWNVPRLRRIRNPNFRPFVAGMVVEEIHEASLSTDALPMEEDKLLRVIDSKPSRPRRHRDGRAACGRAACDPRLYHSAPAIIPIRVALSPPGAPQSPWVIQKSPCLTQAPR